MKRLLTISLILWQSISFAQKPDFAIMISSKGRREIVRFIKDKLRSRRYFEEKKYQLNTSKNLASDKINSTYTFENMELAIPKKDSKEPGDYKIDLKAATVTPNVQIERFNFSISEDYVGDKLYMTKDGSYLGSITVFARLKNNIAINLKDIHFDVSRKKDKLSEIKVEEANLNIIAGSSDDQEIIKFELTVDAYLSKDGEIVIRFDDEEFNSNLINLIIDQDSIKIKNGRSIPFINEGPASERWAQIPNFLLHHISNKLLSDAEKEKKYIKKLLSHFELGIKKGIQKEIKEAVIKQVMPVLNETLNTKLSEVFPYQFKIPLEKGVLKKGDSVKLKFARPRANKNGIYLVLVKDKGNLDLSKLNEFNIDPLDNDFAVYFRCQDEHCILNDINIEGLINDAIPTYKNFESIDTKKFKVKIIQSPKLKKKSLKTEFNIDLQLALLDGTLRFIDDMVIDLGKGIKKTKKKWYEKIPLVGSLISISKKAVGILVQSVGELAEVVYEEFLKTERFFLRVVGKEYFLEVPVQANIKLEIIDPTIVILDGPENHLVRIQIDSRKQIKLQLTPLGISTKLLSTEKLMKSLFELIENQIAKTIEGQDFVIPMPKVAQFRGNPVEFGDQGDLILRGDFDDKIFQDLLNKTIKAQIDELDKKIESLPLQDKSFDEVQVKSMEQKQLIELRNTLLRLISE